MTGRRIRALLIEDNPGDARLIREMLAEAKGASFSLEIADTLAEGLARLEAGGLDVALLDLGLPDSQGLDTLASVEARFARVPVIVLTGLHDEELAATAMRAGAQDYLVKGHVDSELLARAIRYAIERKGVEESLRESEDRYRDLVEHSQELICTHDLEGRILSVNPWAENALGYPPGALVGMNMRDILAPEVRDEFGAYLAETQKRGDSQGLVLVQTSAGERRIWEFNNTLRTEGVAMPIVRGMARDITERKQAEEALRDSEERYRNLIDTARDVVYVISTEGIITSLNPAFEAESGWVREDWIGRHFSALVHPDDFSRAEEMFQNALGGEVCGVYQLRVLLKSGAYGVGEFMSSAIRNRDQVIGVLGIARDITERKYLEEQLLQLQKMETVGRLAGGIAHDFNNLLTAIVGHASFALEELPPRSPAHADIEQVIHTAERAANLTRQLLAFSRRQIIAPKVLSLNTLVADMEKMLRRLIGEDIELKTRPAPDLGVVKADPGQMEQVIVNLAVNARDAMPKGGKLILETSNVALDEEYSRSRPEVVPGDYVMLVVADEGGGMTDEIKSHLFEPFYTTKEIGKGTGLGLATVYGIVKQHEGHIEVESAAGRGTTFRIYLPREKAGAEAVRTRDAQPHSPRGSETVLVVEDDEFVRVLSVRILARLGYNVLEARGGEEAQRIAAQHPGTIHLLITDVIMPRMNGKELADRLTQSCPGLRVLFASGYTDKAGVLKDILQSDAAFIQKPFNAESLARKVREVLEGHNLPNE